MTSLPPFPVPALKLIRKGSVIGQDRYGFPDLVPGTPKHGQVIYPPDLNRATSPPPAAAEFFADGTSSVPYVRLRIDLPDGRVALADVTLDSFVAAADALRPPFPAVYPAGG